MRMQVLVPYIRTFTNYKIKGKIFGLSLNSVGTLKTNMSKFSFRSFKFESK